jgi:hypothetical protein
MVSKILNGEFPYSYKQRGGSAYLIGYDPTRMPRSGQWTVHEVIYKDGSPSLRRI